LDGHPSPIVDAVTNLAVGAIVRRDTDILLVSQQSDDDPEPVWALPGGTVGDAESIAEALRRRVADETGLTRTSTGSLLWVARYSVGGQAFEQLVFEVRTASPYAARSVNRGSLLPGAAWVPLEPAIERLSRMWFTPIRDPAVAYLEGRAAVATVWNWTHLDALPEVVPQAHSVHLEKPSRGEPVAADGQGDEDHQQGQ
jgi:ADP-ribose pyrophosphatase YjhB (NUDIX family)